MSDTLTFDLVTPVGLHCSHPVEMVILPGGEGVMGVLPGHAPLISTIRPGLVEMYKEDKVSDRIFVTGGFVQVSSDSCTLLAKQATNVKNISKEEAEKRLNETQETFDKASDNEKIVVQDMLTALKSLIDFVE